jgi:hypothetical protein
MVKLLKQFADRFLPAEFFTWNFFYNEILTSTATVGLLCVVLPVIVIRLVWYFTGSPARTIARATTTEAVRQPVFILMIVLGTIINVLNMYIPFFTLGDDVKMLKDCGLATLLITGLILAVWTASTSIAEEIEGKTAMTLLSKPINRRQFILGKYIGILQAVLWDVSASGYDLPALHLLQSPL